MPILWCLKLFSFLGKFTEGLLYRLKRWRYIQISSFDKEMFCNWGLSKSIKGWMLDLYEEVVMHMPLPLLFLMKLPQSNIKDDYVSVQFWFFLLRNRIFMSYLCICLCDPSWSYARGKRVSMRLALFYLKYIKSKRFFTQQCKKQLTMEQ